VRPAHLLTGFQAVLGNQIEKRAMSYPKIVENPHYHLWTDALHARSLAHQAHNQWDRGAYVRWAVTTSWTVLEIACQVALSEPNISYRFRENLDAAIAKQGFSKLDWGSGLWQQVIELQDKRKGYMHRFISESEFFLQATDSDHAIKIVRAAVEGIYQHVGSPSPPWIQDDEDRGWDNGRRSAANLTLIHAGASEDDPKVIRICFVQDGKEKLSEVLPGGTDYAPYVDDLIRRIRVPITAVRVYEGPTLIHERETRMRGN
jgi:hypothetical protein